MVGSLIRSFCFVTLMLAHSALSATSVASDNSEIDFVIPRINAAEGRVLYQRAGTPMMLPCVTPMSAELFQKHTGAMYLWRDAHGGAIQNSRSVIFGNGSLSMESVLPQDSHTLYCDVHLSDDTQRTHVHTVVVYQMAKFMMINPFVYTTPSCSDKANNAKLRQLVHQACSTFDASSCPFKARMECSNRKRTEIKDFDPENEYMLKVILEQHPMNDFVIPQCSVQCMQRTLLEHIQSFGDTMLTALLDTEDKPQVAPFEQFHLLKEQMLNRHIKTRCVGGFELYKTLLCVPCNPGTYIEYTYSYNDKKNPRCVPCPVGYYQEQYAADECIRCPLLAMTNGEGTDSIYKCFVSSWNMAVIYYVALGLIAIFPLCSFCWVISQKFRHHGPVVTSTPSSPTVLKLSINLRIVGGHCLLPPANLPLVLFILVAMTTMSAVKKGVHAAARRKVRLHSKDVHPILHGAGWYSGPSESHHSATPLLSAASSRASHHPLTVGAHSNASESVASLHPAFASHGTVTPAHSDISVGAHDNHLKTSTTHAATHLSSSAVHLQTPGKVPIHVASLPHIPTTLHASASALHNPATVVEMKSSPGILKTPKATPSPSAVHIGPATGAPHHVMTSSPLMVPSSPAIIPSKHHPDAHGQQHPDVHGQHHPDAYGMSEHLHDSTLHGVHGTLHPSIASSIHSPGQGRLINPAAASNIHHSGVVHHQPSSPHARAWPPPSARPAQGTMSAHGDVHVSHTKSGHLVYLDKSATSLNSSRGPHHGADVIGRGASSSRRAHMRELAAAVGSRSSGARYGHDGRPPMAHQGIPYPCNRRRGPCVKDIVSGSRSVPGRVVDRQRCGGGPVSVRPASHFS